MERATLIILLKLAFFALIETASAQHSSNSEHRGPFHEHMPKETQFHTQEDTLRTGWNCIEQYVWQQVPTSSKEVLRQFFEPTSLEGLARVEPCLQQYLRRMEPRAEDSLRKVGFLQAALGILAVDRGQLREALVHLEAFHEAVTAHAGAYSQPATDAEICLARLHFLLADFGKAREHYQRVQGSLSFSQSHPYWIRVQEDLLYLFYYHSPHSRADLDSICTYAERIANYYREAFALSPPSLTRILSLAVAAHARLHNFQRGYELIDRMKKEISLSDTSYHLWLLLAQVQLKKEEGLLIEALRYLTQAQVLCRSIPDTADDALEKDLHLLEAEVSLDLRGYALAELCLRRYEQSCMHSPDLSVHRRMRAKCLEGRLLWEQKKNEAATKTCRSIQKDSMAFPERGQLCELLAQLHIAQRQWDSAEVYCKEAVHWYRMVFHPEHENELSACLRLGELYLLKGDVEAAHTWLEVIEGILKGPAHQSLNSRFLFLQASILRAELSLARLNSKNAALKAGEIIAKTYREIRNVRSKVQSIAQEFLLHQLLERLTEASLRLACYEESPDSFVQKAFELVQHSKDFLTPPIDVAKGIASINIALRAHPLIRLYMRRLDKMVKIQTLLSTTWETPDEPDQQNQLLALSQELSYEDSLFVIVRKNAMYLLKDQRLTYFYYYDPVSPDKVSASLHKAETMLDYFVGEKGLYVFVLRRNAPLALRSLPLPPTFHLRGTIQQMYSAMAEERKTMRSFYEPAYQLYQRLFAPIKQFVDKSELIVVIPHKDLYGVPFAALLTTLPKKSDSDNPYKYEYLLKKYAIYYVFSTKKWKLSQRNRRRSDYGYVVVAEKNLQEGIKEAEKVTGITAANRLLTSECNKEQLIDSIQKGWLIHYIGHGYPDGTLDWGGNERLSTLEIASMSLSAHLVFLSACETAVPAYRNSNGLSLAHAFAHAGAACVVGTAWKVGDKATREVTERFYRFLTRPGAESKAQALQKAQLEFLDLYKNSNDSNGPSVHPYHWAGFWMYGNARPLERFERVKLLRALRIANRLIKSMPNR